MIVFLGERELTTKKHNKKKKYKKKVRAQTRTIKGLLTIKKGWLSQKNKKAFLETSSYI